MKQITRFIIVTTSALLLAASAPNPAPKMSERQRAIHVLNRLAFGARPGDADKVMKTGVDTWVDEQLHPDSIPDRAVEARLQQYPTLQMSDAQMIDRYYKPLQMARKELKAGANDPSQLDPKDRAELMGLRKNAQEVMSDLLAQRIIRAADSERQLNEVMVDFWFNHFNVFAGKGVDRFMLTSYERDVIRPHIWGRFEDLLMATAKSPAMLFYLDNARSVAAPENRPPMAQRFMQQRMPKLAKQGGLNENYARELMELHTLGVDGGYTQKDVTELARVLTGWSIAPPQQGSGFVFRRAMHDVQPKTVLGVRFPAGGGIEEGEKMIHILAHSPATAHHIAFELCQRLVSDNPPPALVDRVAQRFLATDGDLRETVRAVVTSPEFWSADDYRAKVKTPFEYAISAVRAIDGQVIDPLPLARQLQQMGEPLYGAQPPTGYSNKSEAWINTGALLARLNFGLALAANKMPGVRSDVVALIPADAAADADKSVDALAQTITGGTLTDETRNLIRARVVERKAPTEDPWDNTQVPMIAGLILGSPEFQRQ